MSAHGLGKRRKWLRLDELVDHANESGETMDAVPSNGNSNATVWETPSGLLVGNLTKCVGYIRLTLASQMTLSRLWSHASRCQATSRDESDRSDGVP